MGYEMTLSDRQWFNLICGMNAGMMIKNKRAPFGRTAVTTYVVGDPAVELPDVVLGVEALDCITEDAYNENANCEVITDVNGQAVSTTEFTQAGYMNHLYSEYPGYAIFGGGSEPQTINRLRWGIVLYFPRDIAVNELAFTICIGKEQAGRMSTTYFVLDGWTHEAEWNSNIAEYFDMTWSPLSNTAVGLTFKMTIRTPGSSLLFTQGRYELGVYACGPFSTRAYRPGGINQYKRMKSGAKPASLELNGVPVIERRSDKTYWSNMIKRCGVDFALATYENCLVCEEITEDIEYINEQEEEETWDPASIAYTDVLKNKYVYTEADLAPLSQALIDVLINQHNGTWEYLWVLRTEQYGWGWIDFQTDSVDTGYEQTELNNSSIKLCDVDVTSSGAGADHLEDLLSRGVLEGVSPNLYWKDVNSDEFMKAVNRFGSVTYEGNLSVDRNCIVYIYIADVNGNQLSVSVPVSLAKGLNKVHVVIPLLAENDMCGEYQIMTSYYYAVDDTESGLAPNGVSATAGSMVTSQGTASAPPFPIKPGEDDIINISDALRVKVTYGPATIDTDVDDTVTVEDDIDADVVYGPVTIDTEVEDTITVSDDIDVESHKEFDGNVQANESASISDDISIVAKTEFSGTVEAEESTELTDETNSSTN